MPDDRRIGPEDAEGPSAPVPAIAITGLRKNYQGLRPLRLRDLTLAPRGRLALSGLDAPAAEVLVNLITGATLPDEGLIRIFGRSTISITSETEWLSWLDQFGVLTPRAVLLEGLSVAQNLAVPFTLDLDPLPPDVLDRVARLAAEVGLDPVVLPRPVAGATPEIIARVHLARAIAPGPRILLLEHPSSGLPRDTIGGLAADVAAVATARGLALLMISEDPEFTRPLTGSAWRLEAATGVLRRRGTWSDWFRR
jgi:ABC-type transporter Mla maintaining outer membrane lipid asymmetry ATPase subunit MlaF